MIVRRERAGDVAAIREVTLAAFETDLEAKLVDALRADPGWIARLSLVAVENEVEVGGETVVGHVVCTRAQIDGRPALGLGPLSVLPARQRTGVGSALMHAVLGAAEALGEPIVVLLGHLDYYPRFGFRPAAELGITPPDPNWGNHFMARPLSDYDSSLRGEFAYAKPFM
ncbi:GNAT family N-acetyltransferase [Allorhizocola rhizosphaerae]|uniref:GNAT family N-acetyltransferase n=1 Tax=Allorhizocola rhizosphaerae TaxID=1872709 RepID=UPI000E3D3F50|nr:N-acetyltransferase [Allorhizocola rhizosphaerae]